MQPKQETMGTDRSRIPAWLGSLVLHLLVVVLLALAMGPPKAAVTEEPDRRAGIVLARANAKSEVEYFQEERRPPINPTANPLPETATEATVADSARFLPEDPATSPLNFGGGARFGKLDLRGDGNPLRHLGHDPNDLEGIERATPKAVGPTGPKVAIGLFGGAEVEGNRFVFLLDRSNSMGARGLAILGHARSELIFALDRLDAKQRFAIIAYNSKMSYTGAGGLQPASDTNQQKAVKFIEGVTATGGTKHFEAIHKALRLQPPPDVIFLLTDADMPHPTGNQLHDLGRSNLRRRTAIHVIQFGRGSPESQTSFFTRLAAENRGSFTYLDVSKTGPSGARRRP